MEKQPKGLARNPDEQRQHGQHDPHRQRLHRSTPPHNIQLGVPHLGYSGPPSVGGVRSVELPDSTYINVPSDAIDSSRENSDVQGHDCAQLTEEEAEVILTVADHLEQYLRNHHPELSEDEITDRVNGFVSVKALRDSFAGMDQVDDILAAAHPAEVVKRWYEK